MKRATLLVVLVSVLGFLVSANLYGQLNWKMSAARDIDNILSEKEQARLYNELLEWRLDNVLPQIMRREGIDMWLVICFEYDEDPVYLTLVPRPIMVARRLAILIFHDSPGGFRKLTANWHGSSTAGAMYTNLFTDQSQGANAQFSVVADYIKQHDPKRIGINYAEHWDYHDDFSHGTGLSAFHKAKLERALDPKYVSRLVSAEKVCIGWYEARSPRELSLYRHICGIGHDLIQEFFSNKVIAPDVTTTQDVVWWIRQRITELGLKAWFHPSISIRRSARDRERYGKDDLVIRRGDVLHCDVGVSYLGLSTDMQHNAYVCRAGEDDAPPGLKQLLKGGNRLQEILLNEYKEGRTGNEILVEALGKATAEGLKPRIYTHPINFYGHGSGMMVGMPEKQEWVPGTGEHPLYPNTVYSIELSNGGNVPEWDNELVTLGLEDEAVFTKDGVNWVDGYPAAYYLIR